MSRLGRIVDLEPNVAIQKLDDWARRVGTNKLLRKQTTEDWDIPATETDYPDFKVQFKSSGGMVVVRIGLSQTASVVDIYSTYKLYVDDIEVDCKAVSESDSVVLYFEDELNEGSHTVRLSAVKSGGTITINSSAVGWTSVMNITEHLGS